MTSQAVQGPCCPSPRLAMYGLSSSPKGAVFLSGFLYSTLIYVLFRNQQCDLSEILNYFFHFDLLFTLKKTSSHPESRKELQNDGKNVVLKPNT